MKVVLDKKKKRNFIIGIVVVAFFLVISFIGLINKKTAPKPPTQQKTFSLIKSTPAGGTIEIVVPNLAIEFIFSDKIDLSTIKVKTTPKTEVEYSLNKTGETLIVRPLTTWEKDQKYTIEIDGASKEGVRLQSPVIYSFVPKTPTKSDFVENFVD